MSEGGRPVRRKMVGCVHETWSEVWGKKKVEPRLCVDSFPFI